ncbi:MAG: methylmalonyl Co-A mutase-associated GTPase MeaB [Thermodesulfobacteriota bacterium]
MASANPLFDSLVSGVLSGDARSLSRLITRIENREPGWKQAMQRLYPVSGNAAVIGITGSPGAGKSTLTNALAQNLAAGGKKIGVIAVDPSSPFSGGALLGDRLRMREAAVNPDIFIRSMATRGALGGLCQGARDVARAMAAFGKDVILIETVGVGQDEVEVVKTADLVLVVLTPGQGDGIQALKAGIMEIADIYVVNKADREGADEVVADVCAMLELARTHDEPDAPVIKASALTGLGVDELTRAVLEGLAGGKNRSAWQRARIKEEVLGLVEGHLLSALIARFSKNGALDHAVDEILAGASDPYTAADQILEQARINP